jgi:hypothetical protein
MYATTHTGLTTPGELQIVARPRIVPSAPMYPVLYTHGAGGRADIDLNYGRSGIRTNGLSDNGVLGVSGDFGGQQTWGNERAMNAMTATYNWLQTQPGVKPGKVAIAGGSMGGLNALIWASQNPDKVSCLSIYKPVINIGDIWANNRGGFASIIDSCYGGHYDPSTMDTVKNPYVMANTHIFDNIPILLNYGLSDTLCLPSFTTSFAATVGANTTCIGRTGGHDETMEVNIDRDQEIAFILSHAR